ncbi:Tat pathway signal sequence domain protein [Streptomyces sp. NPDC006172]|uniref:Tat pathway signal sequence domain protein n=1 Tax=Streptomyces sp. NPDC006172 TaxID=3154470 RepID=UPI0033F2E5B2
MSGVGPVEPGEGTSAREAEDEDPTASPARPPGRLARLHPGRRRTVLAAAAAAALTAGAWLFLATRPDDSEPPPAPPPPSPSQVVDIRYVGLRAGQPTARTHSFAFEVLLSVSSGPPVTTTLLSQPYAGITLTSTPRTPFRTSPDSARKIVITMRVTECGKVPKDAGLPFLDVTLRNTHAMEDHSYILGPRYAQDLSQVLQVACSNDFG